MHSQSLRTGETNRDHLISLIDEFNITDDRSKIQYKIDQTLRSVKYDLNAIETNILLLDVFYKHFKLYDDSVEDRLIGPVIYKENEKLNRPMRLKDLIEAYIDNKIGEIYQLSISEFMRLNLLEINLLLESAGDYLERKNAMLTETANEFSENFEGLLDE